jgi:hypothetical protein
MKTDNDINQLSAELGIVIAVIGIAVMVLALYLGDLYGFLLN